MLWHVLGWLTLLSQLVLGIGCMNWLRVASRDSRSWRRPLPVPRFSEHPLFLSSGADFVGAV